MALDYRIDKIDREILNILMNDARKPFSEIASRLNVSAGTIHIRMQKLREAGIVGKASLEVYYSKINIDITAFIGIHLEKSSFFKEVKMELEKVEEVTHLYYTTGSFGLLASIKCIDTNHLREVVQEKIQGINGIQRTETMISLEESISRPYLL